MNNTSKLQKLRNPLIIKFLILGFFGSVFCLFNLNVMPVSAQPTYARRPENVIFLIRAVGEDHPAVRERQSYRMNIKGVQEIRSNVQGNRNAASEKADPRLTFKSGEKIFIQTLIKNGSQETLRLSRFDWQYQYRCDLLKYGSKTGLTNYRSDQASLFSNKENGIGAGSFRSLPPLLPGKSMDLFIMT